jgi:opacity protein-like surface antigen
VNQYAGTEGGLNYFSTVRYNTNGVTACTGPSARVSDFDFVGKGNVSLGDFEVFGKAGVAISYLTTSGSFNAGNNPNSTACGRTVRTTKFNPTISIGASYDLSQNWVADISWNRTIVGKPINSIDFYALGISYHFVNIYCGQFLCS